MFNGVLLFRRQAAKEEKRRRKIAALKAANAAHHSGTDDGRPAKKISFMQDSESEKEDKHRRMMSESSAHDSEGEGLTMGGRGGKVSSRLLWDHEFGPRFTFVLIWDDPIQWPM